jgi:hypothetical protein
LLKPDKQHPALLLAALVVLQGGIWATAFAQFAVSPIIIETRSYSDGIEILILSIGNSGPEQLDCTNRVSAKELILN